ncbi:hypothetical protein PR048_002564 [Dryococelus australis]|uniref:MADF domain-containing protein n=1 Tax=Dryococelus australis TaxID=614101 RepID=A0ABQ9IMY0_9NEOP|nr:hypothetical protein PR048_002564 [Dryococelus australis]
MNREFLEDWIRIYESEPCLWEVKCKEYHDRVRKDAGYARLLAKLKEVDTNATKDAVIKKINNLRSAYRKEIKKVKASTKSGAAGDEIYKPKLWYFPLLSFLGDQDTPRASRTNVDSSDDGDDKSATEDGPHVVSPQMGLVKTNTFM